MTSLKVDYYQIWTSWNTNQHPATWLCETPSLGHSNEITPRVQLISISAQTTVFQ